MSDHPTFGDPPKSPDRDSVNPDPGPFYAPGQKTGFVPATDSPAEQPASSHHIAPSTPEEEPTKSDTPNWSQVIDELPFAVVIFDDAKQVLHENRLCREIADFGIAEKGGIENWLSSLCPDEAHREEVLETWHSDIWSNQGRQVFSLRVKDYKLRELEFRSSLNKDYGITVVIEDVTDRVKDEENRIHTKKKYRSLFANSENGTVLVDRTGRIIDANPAFRELAERELRELRMSPFASLFASEDIPKIGCPEDDSEVGDRQMVTLACPSEEKQIGMRAMPISTESGTASMVAYLFDTAAHLEIANLKERIGIVSGKAIALLNAVPDLIFLLNADFTVADFIPPPEHWEEIDVSDEWRGKQIAAVWPVLGELLDSSKEAVVDAGKTVRADLNGTTRNEDGEKPYIFSITASSGGDGQWLVVVRKNSSNEAAQPNEVPQPTAATDIAPAPEVKAAPAADPLSSEISQHGFRNQLQLVTSLFSLEPQGAAARDAFLRWQIRLRAMAQAVAPAGSKGVPLVEMIRSLANEICSLTGTGPARRAVVVSGSPELIARNADSSLLALTVGELMRLVLAARQQGRGPDIIFELNRDDKGCLFMKARAGENRRFISADEESELETLEILASQMRGYIQGDSEVTPAEWELTAPILIA